MRILFFALTMSLLFYAAAYSVANADPVHVMTNVSTNTTYTHPDWKYKKASVQVAFTNRTTGAVEIKASSSGKVAYTSLHKFSNITTGTYNFDAAGMYDSVQICHTRSDKVNPTAKVNVWIFGE